MSTPDQRARDKDRDAAIEVVEAAWAKGLIVQADRDHRVSQLQRAETLSEIRTFTHDLQLPGPTAFSSPAVPQAPVPHPYASPPVAGTTSSQASVGKPAGCAGLAILVFVILTIGGVVVALVSVSSGLDDDPGAFPGLGGVEAVATVDALSRAGHRQLVRDVEAATGSTEAFEAVIYPDYAVVHLPVDARSQRYSYWFWDGDLEEMESRGTSSYERFDLADVDMGVVVRLVKRARGQVDDPTSWYAIVRAPDDQGAAIWAYASNDFDEGGYVSATPDGRVVMSSTWP